MRAFLKLAIQLFSEPMRYKDLDAIYIFTETPDNEAPMWDKLPFIWRDLDLVDLHLGGNKSEASRIPEFWLSSETGSCGGWYIEDQTGRNVTVYRGSESLQRTFQEAWIRFLEKGEEEHAAQEPRPPPPTRTIPPPTLRTVPGMCDKKLNILHTYSEAVALVHFMGQAGVYGREHDDPAGASSDTARRPLRVGLLAPPLHVLRSFVSTVSALYQADLQEKVSVFSVPGVAVDWRGEVVHSQGRIRGTRAHMLDSEIDRILRYSEKGDLVEAERVLEYLERVRA